MLLRPPHAGYPRADPEVLLLRTRCALAAIKKVKLAHPLPEVVLTGLLAHDFAAGADGFGGLGGLVCYFGAGVDSGGFLDQR